MDTPLSPLTLRNPLKAGIGLRGGHHGAFHGERPSPGFLEVHAENYMGGGAAPALLEVLRRDYPLSIHGVGLSLAGASAPASRHLYRLRRLIERFEPFLVSEHLAWSGSQRIYLNDLLPIPYTEEALDTVVAHVTQVQEYLQRRILMENPSTYIAYVESAIPEAEFLAALARRTGCGLLCDVNNIYVSCSNHGWDAQNYLRSLPAEAVMELHLAGHAVNIVDGARILIDDHGGPVSTPVWQLYETAVRHFPHAHTLVEWDADLPSLAVLVNEARRADRRRAAALYQSHVRAA